MIDTKPERKRAATSNVKLNIKKHKLEDDEQHEEDEQEEEMVSETEEGMQGEIPFQPVKRRRVKPFKSDSTLSLNLKAKWEILRGKKCTEKEKLLKEMMDMAKGHIKQLVFAHDTVRVIESMITFGGEQECTIIFDELHGSLLELCKSKFAKFLIVTFLRHGTPKQKASIYKSLRGNFVQLFNHGEARSVVRTLFEDFSDNYRRKQIVQEFFGREYALFEDKPKSLSEILAELDDNKKRKVFIAFQQTLMKLIDKKTSSYHLIHWLLFEYFENAWEKQQRLDMIEVIKEFVVYMLHTKMGCRVGQHAIWNGTAKDRKHMIKTFKPHAVRVAKYEYGRLAICAALDVVDDTKLLQQHIVSELTKNAHELANDSYGWKVLDYLMTPRNPKTFCADTRNILSLGDNNENSKKDSETRQRELRSYAAEPLATMVNDNIEQFLRNRKLSILAESIVSAAEIDQYITICKTLAQLLITPYTGSNEHLVEDSSANMFIKRLILIDKERGLRGDKSFCGILLSTVNESVLRTWYNCNRGAYLLVLLMESEDPDVRNTMEKILLPHKKEIKSKREESKNIEVLLKKFDQLMQTD